MAAYFTYQNRRLEQKKALCRNKVLFRSVRKVRNYYGFLVGDGTGVFIILAGFMFDAGVVVVLDGFILPLFEAGRLAAGVETGADVDTGAGVETFADLAFTLTLVPESPHAMPSALNPRTVESTITFFILI